MSENKQHPVDGSSDSAEPIAPLPYASPNFTSLILAIPLLIVAGIIVVYGAFASKNPLFIGLALVAAVAIGWLTKVAIIGPEDRQI